MSVEAAMRQKVGQGLGQLTIGGTAARGEC